ncbi:MAG: substrate-binding domain-containing protein [Phycisphaerae bacterium]
MKCIVAILTSLAVLTGGCSTTSQTKYATVYGSGSRELVVATGSPGELGLLKALAEQFADKADAKVLWYKAGSGPSLELLYGKEADVVMVHAPQAEQNAVRQGWAVRRSLVGSNEFYIVGPADDPAGVRSASTAAQAYRKVAEQGAKFLSRADNSGTHKREMAIWRRAGIEPEGPWYIATHDFMMATLLRANAEKGYFMTDSSTWFVGKKNTPHLRLLFKGDPVLVNVYHALCQPVGATSGAEVAGEFVDFLASEEAQQIIRTYGIEQYGEALYRDAQESRQFE